ncbi:MAG: type II secretion system protein [Candidatus Omnitrophota bacterium]
MCGKRKNRLAGFTLLELLLAVTIFSIVTSVIYSSFRLGIASWKSIEANLSHYQKIRHAVNQFTQDITNTFSYEPMPFIGAQGKIEFAGFIKDKNSANGQIAKISYFYYNEGYENGFGKLMRQVLPYSQALKTQENPESGKDLSFSRVLLDDVIDFSISYCYGSDDETAPLEWFSQWLAQDKIPCGVKLELVLKDDYAQEGKRHFEKRIYIPIGQIGDIAEIAEQ